jgi:hypothetical protein
LNAAGKAGQPEIGVESVGQTAIVARDGDLLEGDYPAIHGSGSWVLSVGVERNERAETGCETDAQRAYGARVSKRQLRTHLYPPGTMEA